jgi:hypothetical protein
MIESSISILGFYIHHLDSSSVVSLSYDMGDDSMQAEAVVSFSKNKIEDLAQLNSIFPDIRI